MYSGKEQGKRYDPMEASHENMGLSDRIVTTNAFYPKKTRRRVNQSMDLTAKVNYGPTTCSLSLNRPVKVEKKKVSQKNDKNWFSSKLAPWRNAKSVIPRYTKTVTDKTIDKITSNIIPENTFRP